MRTLILWSDLEFLQQALRWRWTLFLMQDQGLQVVVGCGGFECAVAGLCVWAAGGDVTAVEAGAGSLYGSVLIGNVGEPVCTGLLA